MLVLFSHTNILFDFRRLTWFLMHGIVKTNDNSNTCVSTVVSIVSNHAKSI